ncbi:MAG: RsmE family RNA methyltransferase [Actinomycetota bacterium]|nr:RsmE family RNA methyltransferase [Actinomycetota bacterium]
MADGSAEAGDWHLASKAHVIAPSASIGALSEAQLHHLFTVRRLAPGEELTIADGRGGLALARVRGGASKRRRGAGADELLEEVGARQVAPPPFNLEMVLSVIDFEPLGLAVRMLTELGVSRITLVWARRSHSVAGAERKVTPERLTRVCAEAAGQCRSLFLPELGFQTLSEVLDRVVVCEPGAEPLRARPGALLIGPEGGFAAGEIPDEVPRASLPGRVLRAETAAVVAAATAMALMAT